MLDPRVDVERPPVERLAVERLDVDRLLDVALRAVERPELVVRFAVLRVEPEARLVDPVALFAVPRAVPVARFAVLRAVPVAFFAVERAVVAAFFAVPRAVVVAFFAVPRALVLFALLRAALARPVAAFPACFAAPPADLAVLVAARTVAFADLFVWLPAFRELFAARVAAPFFALAERCAFVRWAIREFLPAVDPPTRPIYPLADSAKRSGRAQLTTPRGRTPPGP